jgi:hydroxymethylpyrimidine pyrophosphatase-like HAD family hydrolase
MFIEVDGDTLVEDGLLAREWQTTRRTLARYEQEGLPVCYVSGRKYRPLKACREWLAGRIRKPNPRRGRAA